MSIDVKWGRTMNKDKKKSKFFVKLLAILGTVYGLLYTILQIIDSFWIEIFPKGEGSFIYLLLFVMGGLIIGLIITIFSIVNFYKEQINTNEDVINESVSLIDMIKEAFQNNRDMEVIKLGNAVIDSLWYSDKYQLRMDIAKLVKESSSRIGEKYFEAKVLIEDLGNGRIEAQKDLTIAIQYLIEGIDIAERNDIYFLCSRGYRHLACAYVLKFRDSVNSLEKERFLKIAQENIEKAEEYIKKIKINGEKNDAKASVLYAKNKILTAMGMYEENIEVLKEIKKVYENLSKINSYKYKVKDRLTNVDREIGNNLLLLWAKKKEELRIELNENQNIVTDRINILNNQIKKYENDAIEALNKSLRDSEILKNYNNILKVCNILIGYYIEKDPSHVREDIKERIKYFVQIGDRYFDKAEIEKDKDTFKKLKENL